MSNEHKAEMQQKVVVDANVDIREMFQLFQVQVQRDLKDDAHEDLKDDEEKKSP